MQDLVNAIADMMEDEAMALTKKHLEEGVPPMKILDAYKDALAIVGKRFEEGKYFVPELILAGEMMKAASDMRMSAEPARRIWLGLLDSSRRWNALRNPLFSQETRLNHW